jgi:hypothetical protein
MNVTEKVEEEATETETSESDDVDEDDKNDDSDDSGEDVASLKKSPIQKTPKFSSNFGSFKSSSSSSHVKIILKWGGIHKNILTTY